MLYAVEIEENGNGCVFSAMNPKTFEILGVTYSPDDPSQYDPWFKKIEAETPSHAIRLFREQTKSPATN